MATNAFDEVFPLVKKAATTVGGFFSRLGKQIRPAAPSKPLVFTIGEGLEKGSVLRPGPTPELAALPKDEPVSFSLDETKQKISPYASARQAVQKHIDAQERLEKNPPKKDFVSRLPTFEKAREKTREENELIRFAKSITQRQKSGLALSEEEIQIKSEGEKIEKERLQQGALTLVAGLKDISKNAIQAIESSLGRKLAGREADDVLNYLKNLRFTKGKAMVDVTPEGPVFQDLLNIVERKQPPLLESPKSKVSFSTRLKQNIDPELEIKEANDLQQKIGEARLFGRTLSQQETVEARARIRSEIKQSEQTNIPLGDERGIARVPGIGDEVPNPPTVIDGQIVNETPGVSPTESIAQEARKYKSAEEFVKAQENRIIRAFDRTGILKPNDYKAFNDLFVSGQKNLDISPELFKNLPKNITGEDAINEIMSTTGGSESYDQLEEIASTLLRLGYDDAPTFDSSTSIPEQFINGKKLPTPILESDLLRYYIRELKDSRFTDIYNQATKAPSPITAPAVNVPPAPSPAEVSPPSSREVPYSVYANHFQRVSKPPVIKPPTPLQRIGQAANEAVESPGMTAEEKAILQQEFNNSGFNTSPREFTSNSVEDNYQTFKRILADPRLRSAKAKEAVISGDVETLRRELVSRNILNKDDVDNLLYTQEGSGDDLLDQFKARIMKENPGLAVGNQVAKNLGLHRLDALDLSGAYENRKLRETVKRVNISIDKAAQNSAYADTVLGNVDAKGIKGFLPDLKQAFKDWVNARSASKLEGYLQKKAFARFDKLGQEGIIKFQAGDRSGGLADVEKYFDAKHAEVEKAGIELGYLNNYVPQLWKETESQVLEVLGRRLSRRPSFSLDRIIETYKDGIAFGLTPRYTKLSELIGWYERVANKTIADRAFFEFLGKNSLIQPSGKQPLGWKVLDPDHFPKIKVTIGGDSEYGGVYFAPPDLADDINNYLRPPAGGPILAFANFASGVKNIVLSSGIPRTGLNAHGLNILARFVLSANNPVSALARGASWLVNPKAAETFFNTNSETAIDAVKNGLRLSTESDVVDREFEGLLRKGVGRLLDWQQRNFEFPLFSQVIPAVKMTYYNTLVKQLSTNLAPREAKQTAAVITNNFFGGINSEQLARNKNTQTLLRAVLLAPDWAETQLRLAKGIGQGSFNYKNPEFKAYRTLVRNLIGAYILANFANYLINGHFMYENDSGHTFEMQIGKSASGKNRYFRPFGTAADFARIPYDVALSLAKKDLSAVGRVIRNRLSIPTANVISALSNSDYLNRPIFNKDRYGNPIPLQQQLGSGFNLTAGMFLPQYGRALVDLSTGKSNWEEAIFAATEAPVRYGSPNNPFYEASQDKTQKNVDKREAFIPTYLQIRSLVSDGKNAEAQAVLDKLTAEDYAMYKKIRAGEKQQLSRNAEQDFFPTFQEIRELVKDGKEEEALARVKELSDEDYQQYQKLRTKFSDL